MLKWLLNKWREHQRAIDMQILWPICLRQANEAVHGEDWHGFNPLTLAKMAFAMHCMNDPAWMTLGEQNVIDFIEKLDG